MGCNSIHSFGKDSRKGDGTKLLLVVPGDKIRDKSHSV